MTDTQRDLERTKAVLRRFEIELKQQRELKRRYEELVVPESADPVSTTGNARLKRLISELEDKIVSNEKMVKTVRGQIDDLERKVAEEHRRTRKKKFRLL